MTDTNNTPPVSRDLPVWLLEHVDEVSAWGAAPVARGCWVVGCGREAHLHGLCRTHHDRAVRTWRPRPSHSADHRNGLRRARSAGVVLSSDEVPTTTTIEEVN